jgi:hypothetical protein
MNAACFFGSCSLSAASAAKKPPIAFSPSSPSAHTAECRSRALHIIAVQTGSLHPPVSLRSFPNRETLTPTAFRAARQIAIGVDSTCAIIRGGPQATPDGFNPTEHTFLLLFLYCCRITSHPRVPVSLSTTIHADLMSAENNIGTHLCSPRCQYHMPLGCPLFEETDGGASDSGGSGAPMTFSATSASISRFVIASPRETIAVHTLYWAVSSACGPE